MIERCLYFPEAKLGRSPFSHLSHPNPYPNSNPNLTIILTLTLTNPNLYSNPTLTLTLTFRRVTEVRNGLVHPNWTVLSLGVHPEGVC